MCLLPVPYNVYGNNCLWNPLNTVFMGITVCGIRWLLEVRMEQCRSSHFKRFTGNRYSKFFTSNKIQQYYSVLVQNIVRWIFYYLEACRKCTKFYELIWNGATAIPSGRLIRTVGKPRRTLRSLSVGLVGKNAFIGGSLERESTARCGYYSS